MSLFKYFKIESAMLGNDFEIIFKSQENIFGTNICKIEAIYLFWKWSQTISLLNSYSIARGPAIHMENILGCKPDNLTCAGDGKVIQAV